MLSRAHAGGLTLTDFLALLDAFELVVVRLCFINNNNTCQELMYGEISDAVIDLSSERLKGLATIAEHTDGGLFPDIQELFTEVIESFERAEAKEKGVIVKVST